MDEKRKGEIALRYLKFTVKEAEFCTEKNWNRKKFKRAIRQIARNCDIDYVVVKKLFNTLIEGTAEKVFSEKKLYSLSCAIVPDFIAYNGEFIMSPETRACIAEEAHELGINFNEYLEFNLDLYIQMATELLKPVEMMK